ncbi:DUF4350 domain-containing protein [soil metagenome]
MSSTINEPRITEASTPTLRRAGRRSLFWILAAVFVLLVIVITLALAGSGVAGVPFSASNPAPAGSKAIASVLDDQGVEVTDAQSYRSAQRALGDSRTATLFVYDPEGNLDSRRLTALADAAKDVVILTPGFRQLNDLAPSVAQAGIVKKKALTSDCSLTAVTNAGSVTGTGRGYRLVEPQKDAATCLGSGRSTFSVIQVPHGTGTVTVVGTTAALSNEHVAERGNAALALNLLGPNPRLVWYLPTIADSPVTGKPSVAALTPLWVTPVLVLLAITTIAAGIWRGRRLGPLVIENLPVVVRSSETMEGRARLYQRSGARLRALDALRVGAVGRLATLCGLGRLATVDEVIAAAAKASGRDPGSVRRLLLDDHPGSDRELVRLSDELLGLEADVSRGIRPS